MKLPNTTPVPPSLVAQIVDVTGRAELANSLDVTEAQIIEWMNTGTPSGPISAVLRYLAEHVQIPTSVDEQCVLCARRASEVVAFTPVCTTCCDVTDERVRPLGMGYWERRILDVPDGVRSYVGISAMRAFERPMLVTFSRQPPGVRKEDPEIGDEVFDKEVWIETDDYEAVFDTFQHRRRRQLVYNITRSGSLKIDVNDLVYNYTSSTLYVPRPELPISMVLLAWSLLHETSNPWAFG